MTRTPRSGGFAGLLRAKQCCLERDALLSADLQEVVEDLQVSNVFNPSFASDEGLGVFAFRAIPNGNDALCSYVSVEDEGGRWTRNISIDLYDQVGGARIIDPKVFRLDDAVYVTFNTGYNPDGNQVFTMKVYPELEPPRRLVYRGRAVQERNWAFFSEGGELYALYWISPLKILRVAHRGSTTWELEDYYSGAESFSEFTIGTQLSMIAGKHFFVGHQKLRLFGKKIYLGRLCLFDFASRQIKQGQEWLIHSRKSLLGDRIKHNTNLLSCTYFSGIQVEDDKVRLGYGVNDFSFGFSTHLIEDLYGNPMA